LVGAYAWHERLPVLFSMWTLLFSSPLVLLCSAIGSIVCLVIARWMPRGRWLFWLLLLAVLVGVGHVWRQMAVSSGAQDEALLLTQLIPGLKLASNPFWPSWWVSEGIMALTRGQWVRGVMFLGLLVSNLLMIGLIVEAVGQKLFYDAWQKAQFSAGLTKRTGVLLRPLEEALRFLAADARALIMKDIRMFFRDATQWSQGLIFFGLLGIYFLNLRNLHYHKLPAEWRNLIAFLNVFSVSAVLCSFGARFVFPQLSLEGHGFWVIGLSPTTMGRVLLAKFGLALAGMTVISIGLMVVSTKMLLVPPEVQAAAVGIALAMSLAISGLSTGLGAVFMDLKQKDPVAIVSGFGGTLNLVLSLVFMGLVIVPFGVVFHLHYLGHLPGPALHRWIAWASLWTLGATAVATLAPLVFGRRSLQKREY
jgi:ABC-2 type transport system permease protein